MRELVKQQTPSLAQSLLTAVLSGRLSRVQLQIDNDNGGSALIIPQGWTAAPSLYFRRKIAEGHPSHWPCTPCARSTASRSSIDSSY
jgi:hypothetical protein